MDVLLPDPLLLVLLMVHVMDHSWDPFSNSY